MPPPSPPPPPAATAAPEAGPADPVVSGAPSDGSVPDSKSAPLLPRLKLVSRRGVLPPLLPLPGRAPPPPRSRSRSPDEPRLPRRLRPPSLPVLGGRPPSLPADPSDRMRPTKDAGLVARSGGLSAPAAAASTDRSRPESVRFGMGGGSSDEVAPPASSVEASEPAPESRDDGRAPESRPAASSASRAATGSSPSSVTVSRPPLRRIVSNSSLCVDCALSPLEPADASSAR
mmetsp:Transcript_3912/g.14538  ORF Transcript_3912/g.14538 Transcript_3912/m.14538 type:complete len:231 (+) Transcript_3912:723-1415(+)